MSDTLQSNPNYNRFEIGRIGETTVTKFGGDNTGTTIIFHSFGIQPIVIGFIQQLTINDVASGSGQILPYLEFDATSGHANIYVQAFTTTSQIKFRINSPDTYESNTVVATIKYYLLIERTN